MAHSDVRPLLHLPPAPPELRGRLAAGRAIAWSEPVTIVTYDPGEPLREPMFLARRVYQGSSGRVYPIPFVDRISGEGRPRRWQAVHLENEYVRVLVLPEIGGRIHVGLDKTNGYDFFYRNNVIKPALVGLAGPWISGGVELNWPQHHRPGTFLPTEWRIQEDEDGTATVWCGDHEPMTRMAATHGVRLRPGRAVVELEVRLHNRTSERQTFLWWANVAARVHEHYQSFFPPDVQHVADHARRAVTAFPAADRPYYGVDYPARARERPGADRIDFFANIPVPTSYMVVDSDEGFFGGYDHAADAGFVHVADRRISPGKKQWTWGSAPFGDAWHAHLTDADGPYVELMAGVYTDNQPDFSWLLPGETKTFTQFWYPIRDIGVAHAASTEVAVHVGGSDDGAATGGVPVRHRAPYAGVAVTRCLPGARIAVRDASGRELVRATADLSPAAPFVAELPAGADGRLSIEVRDRAGALLLSWTRPDERARPEPATASEPPAPEEVESVEELVLVGVHLVQYRHPTRSPLPYWREALRRDDGNAAAHLALGDWEYRHARYPQADAHLARAIARLTRRNANPADTEALYLRGLVLRRMDRRAEARAMFAKAAWDGARASAALLEHARLDAEDGADARALGDLEAAARRDPQDVRVWTARAVLLERAGRHGEARECLATALRIDPLDVTARVVADPDAVADPHALLDAAGDLARLGEHERAIAALDRAVELPVGPLGNARPLARYLAALEHERAGRPAEATRARAEARAQDRALAFPSGLDAHDALTAALRAEPDDAVAHSLLGMLLYDLGRGAEALDSWRTAIDLGLVDAVLRRNAALAAYEAGDERLAWDSLVSARALDPADGRLLYELDQLAERLEHPAVERLARLEAALPLVLARDDLAVVYADLLVDAGRASEAVALLASRVFQPWEGGEGRALAAWDRARAAAGLPREDPPASLGEARPLVPPPAPVRPDGTTDYFATSLPELLLFPPRERMRERG